MVYGRHEQRTICLLWVLDGEEGAEGRFIEHNLSRRDGEEHRVAAACDSRVQVRVAEVPTRAIARKVVSAGPLG
jgi:hypothetical protein